LVIGEQCSSKELIRGSRKGRLLACLDFKSLSKIDETMATTKMGAKQRSQVEILGVGIDQVTMKDTLNQIEAFIQEGGPHLIVTADAVGLVIANENEDFKSVVKNASLVTPDGSGVLWAAKKVGSTFRAKVSGVDIVDRVCALSADKGTRIFFLGAEPGIAELAAEKLRLKHPGCNIVGTRHGYFPSESDEIVAKEIGETKPDVLFVAMGMPRQELFYLNTQHITGAKVGIGVGGSLDVYSGKTKRAPKIVQALRMEWLWRLALNPTKIAKVKLLPKFALMVLRGKN